MITLEINGVFVEGEYDRDKRDSILDIMDELLTLEAEIFASEVRLISKKQACINSSAWLKKFKRLNDELADNFVPKHSSAILESLREEIARRQRTCGVYENDLNALGEYA